jgi:hypothetical protein
MKRRNRGTTVADETARRVVGIMVLLDQRPEPLGSRRRICAGRQTDTFVLPPQTVQCSQRDQEPWTCTPRAEAKTPESPDIKVREEMGPGTVKVRDEKIAGREARTFSFPTGSEIGEMCLRSNGVVARMVAGSGRFDLIDYSRSVPDDAFSVPAGR